LSTYVLCDLLLPGRCANLVYPTAVSGDYSCSVGNEQMNVDRW